MFDFKHPHVKLGTTMNETPRQIVKLASQLAKVGSQMFSNPVIALKNELISISNSPLQDDHVARDFTKVPLKYHALLLHEYVQQWKKLKHVDELEHTDTIDKFEDQIMNVTMQIRDQVEEGYQTPLIVFDQVMHASHQGVNQVAFEYLNGYKSEKFALLWLDDLAKMGLDA